MLNTSSKGARPGTEMSRVFMRRVMRVKNLQTEYADSMYYDTPEEVGLTFNKTELPILKLSMVILIHLFYEDDKKISFKEKRQLKKEFKSITELTKEDFSSLELLVDQKDINRQFVYKYIREHELDEDEVTYAFDLVKTTMTLDMKYTILLDKLINEYKVNL